jgi:IS5 family transposase
LRAQGHAHRCHRDRPASKGDKDAAWVRHRTRAPAHGYKAHLAAAKDSGIIRGVETTPANEADVNIAPSIIPDEPGEVYADRAYDAGGRKGDRGQGRNPEAHAQGPSLAGRREERSAQSSAAAHSRQD